MDIEAARLSALEKELGSEDAPKYRFTLQAPSMMPVMRFADDESLRKEVCAKLLKGHIAPTRPNKSLCVRKPTGSVFVDKKCFVSVLVTGEHSAKLVWKHPQRIALGIQEEDLENIIIGIQTLD